MPFYPGQRVSLTFGNSRLSGEILSLEENEAQIACDLAPPGGESEITWPDGRKEPFDLRNTPHYARLILKIPLPLLPKKKAPTPERREESRPIGMNDHRRSVRIECHLEATLEDLTGTFQMRTSTINLSSGGAQILTEYPLIIDREYLFVLSLDEEYSIRVRVLRRLDDKLYAIKFLLDRESGMLLMRRILKVVNPKPRAKTRNLRQFTNFRKN